MNKQILLAAVFLLTTSSFSAGVCTPSHLQLGVLSAYAGDEVKIVHKIEDKTKFGITLENNSTKSRIHLSSVNYQWNGPNLSIVLPADLQAGNYTVSLQENGTELAASTLAVKVHAVVISSNLEGVLPGQPVIIQGTGFSPRPSDNLVEFTTLNENVDSLGGVRYYDGPVATYRVVPTQATPTTLTVVAPQEVANYVTSQVSAPTRVTVKVYGVPASGSVKIFLSIREWERGTTQIQQR